MKVTNTTPIVSNEMTAVSSSSTIASAVTKISTIYGNCCSKTLNMPICSSSSSFNKNDTIKMTNGDTLSNTANTLFCEQVNTVTNLFEKWNNCERTVVMYALLKRLQYSSLKFLQYSIDSTLTKTMSCSTNLSTVVVDMNANNPSYLTKLLQSYRTSSHHDADTVVSTNINKNVSRNKSSSSSISDKDFISCYGTDFQLAAGNDENQRKVDRRTKEEILHELINMLPLLKPGNEDAKFVYMQLIPLAVEDALTLLVPFDLVQQIFSYMLIHPAILSEDRRLLNDMLRHLEEKIPQTATSCPVLNLGIKTMNKSLTRKPTLNENVNSHHNNTNNNLATEYLLNTTTTTSTLPSVINSNQNNYQQNYNNGSTSSCSSLSSVSSRNSDWQTIAPPCKYLHGQQNQQQQQQNQVKYSENADRWSTLIKSHSMSMATNIGGTVGHTSEHYCDNFDGIKLNELASSQNSLCLSMASTRLDISDANSAMLANGVAAAAVTNSTDLSLNTQSTASSLLLGGGNCNSNPIINIISNSGNNCLINHNISGIVEDTADTSFSKNGTEILDFDSNPNDSCNNSSSNIGQIQSQQPLGFAIMLMNNNRDHLSFNRLSLDSKLGALKTRRSNSLTTQTFLSSTSSSNSSVITVNDTYSNSTENLAQFFSKPRSYSLSIEHHRNSLTNSGSDTRLDDFKPSYIKFQNPNIGMSSIGLWLKSLRLHKYLDLFKEMTYEAMLQITEDYLINLGVTKGASHKLALCIEKLQDRQKHLIKMEEELINGQMKLQAALEELANLVLTPMKPIDIAGQNTPSDNENVALHFIRVLDLTCNIIYKESYALIDDDTLSLLIWIIDRMLHNEAFAHHINQLKEHKFKLSKVKMSLTPKAMHLPKNASSSSLNKSGNFGRWSGKLRKSDQKNGSNDRINYRKNSNDMPLFPLSCLQQQQQAHVADNNNTHNSDNNQYIANSNGNNINNNGFHKYTTGIGVGQFDKQHLQYQHQHHLHQSSPMIPLLRNSHYSKIAMPQQHTTTTATTSSSSNLVMQNHRHSLILANGQQQSINQSQTQAQQQKSLSTVTPIRRISYSNVEVLDDSKIESERMIQPPLPPPPPPSQHKNNFALALVNSPNNHLLHLLPTQTERQEKQQQQQQQQLQLQQQALTENSRKNTGIIVTSTADGIVHQQSQQHSTLLKSLKTNYTKHSKYEHHHQHQNFKLF